MVQIFIDAGIEVNLEDSESIFPLHHAVESNNLEIVSLLLDNGANVNASARGLQGLLPLALNSIKNGDIAIQTLLIQHGAVVDAVDGLGRTALMLAASFSDFVKVQALVDAGADINKVDSVGYPVLFYAIESHRLDVVQYLVSEGFNINVLFTEDEVTPLMIACSVSSFEISSYLINLSASINTVDREGNSCLIYALKSDVNLELIEFLLDQNANVDIQDYLGKSPLYYAIGSLDLAIVNSVLDAGPDITTLTIRNDSLLTRAARVGKVDIVDRLVGLGLDIDHQNRPGITPIMYAVRLKRLAVVGYLKNAGADLALQDNQGRNVYDYAEGNAEILAILGPQ